MMDTAELCTAWKNRYVDTTPTSIMNCWNADPQNDFSSCSRDLIKLCEFQLALEKRANQKFTSSKNIVRWCFSWNIIVPEEIFELANLESSN